MQASGLGHSGSNGPPRRTLIGVSAGLRARLGRRECGEPARRSALGLGRCPRRLAALRRSTEFSRRRIGVRFLDRCNADDHRRALDRERRRIGERRATAGPSPCGATALSFGVATLACPRSAGATATIRAGAAQAQRRGAFGFAGARAPSIACGTAASLRAGTLACAFSAGRHDGDAASARAVTVGSARGAPAARVSPAARRRSASASPHSHVRVRPADGVAPRPARGGASGAARSGCAGVRAPLLACGAAASSLRGGVLACAFSAGGAATTTGAGFGSAVSAGSASGPRRRACSACGAAAVSLRRRHVGVAALGPARFAHDLFREPVSIRDRRRGHAVREHAPRAPGSVSGPTACG